MTTLLKPFERRSFVDPQNGSFRGRTKCLRATDKAAVGRGDSAAHIHGRGVHGTVPARKPRRIA
jgi:hypothetical protein